MIGYAPSCGVTTVSPVAKTSIEAANAGDLLYWTADAQLLQVTLGVTSPAIIATDVGAPVATDGVHVVWKSDDAISRALAAGEEPTRLVTSVSPRALALASGFVYWTDALTDGVFRAPIDGGTAARIVDGVAAGFAITSTDLVVHDGARLTRTAPDGAHPRVIASGFDAITSVALAPDAAYISGVRDGETAIFVAPLAFGVLKKIAPIDGDSPEIVLDGARLITANDRGLRALSIVDGSLTTIATHAAASLVPCPDGACFVDLDASLLKQARVCGD